MTIDPELRVVGQELLLHAREEAEFSAQRGRSVVDELFPYIYTASKRMSTRAISRWLLETQKIKLSAVTIAKALRESEKHWESYFEEIEPAAEIVARAHEMESGRELLEDANRFFGVISGTPRVSGSVGMDEYQVAQGRVTADWFQALDDAAREDCLAAVYVAERREEEAEGKSDETGRK